jgi:septum formation protein
VAPELILASRSPQRRAILEQLGLAFTVVVPEVEEREDGPAEEVALENAARKAQAVAAASPDAIVVGVDTVVSLDGQLFGKPRDVDQARETLLALAARSHQVLSAVCVVGGGDVRVATATTRVTLRRADRGLIDWYLESGEWRERAGGYAIQGRGAALVGAIEGDYTNVVGLPVGVLLHLVPELLEG